MNQISRLINSKKFVKNDVTEEVDIPTDLDQLNRWTIPRINITTIYKLGTFEKIGLKQVVKTTEESISLNNEEMTLKLLSNHDLNPYKRNNYKFIHIGLVQVAFKPLTLEGLPESFIASLRDGRNLNWKKSIMGMIKSSLAHGPVYFNVYPNITLSLTDENILDALTLNVKTHGYNYAPGSEVICICYRIYYKPLYTLNPCCKIMDKQNNETIIIESNFNKSEITTRRKIKWEEIDFPENWKIERAIAPRPPVHTDLENMDVSEDTDGSVNISFNNRFMNRSYSSVSSFGSRRSFISPIDHMDLPPSTSRHSISHTRGINEVDRTSSPEEFRESRVEELIIPKTDNIVRTKQAETMSQMSYDF